MLPKQRTDSPWRISLRHLFWGVAISAILFAGTGFLTDHESEREARVRRLRLHIENAKRIEVAHRDRFVRLTNPSDFASLADDVCWRQIKPFEALPELGIGFTPVETILIQVVLKDGSTEIFYLQNKRLFIGDIFSPTKAELFRERLLNAFERAATNSHVIQIRDARHGASLFTREDSADAEEQ